MELGNQDYKYYTESDGDKKAAAAGAAVGGSLGAWHGLNKAVGKEYEKYKKASQLYDQTANHNINLTNQRIRKSKIGPSKKYRNRFKNMAKKSAKLADEQFAKADHYASPGRIKDSINKVGKKKVLKYVAKYGAPTAVATGVAAYGLHKLYKHRNESVEDGNMNTIALYETEYDGVYATEDGYLVDEDGNLYDGNGDLIQESAISFENDNEIALYETEMPDIYATEDGYFVDEDGNLYDGNGDLVEEDAVVLERGNLEKTKGMAKASAAGAAGAGLGYVAGTTARSIKALKRAAAIDAKHLATGKPYASRAAKAFSHQGISARRLAKDIKKAGRKGAAVGAGVGLVAYGAKKAYDHFKGKNEAKCESTVTNYDGLA